MMKNVMLRIMVAGTVAGVTAPVVAQDEAGADAAIEASTGDVPQVDAEATADVAAADDQVEPDTGADAAPETKQATAPVPTPEPVVAGYVEAPEDGKGQVVFFRKGGFVGSAISCASHENGEKVTSLPPGRYAVVTAEPGIHEYTVKSEAKDTLRLEVEEGETYFAECSIKMGFFAGRPNLAPTDKARFLELSEKLKPVEKE